MTAKTVNELIDAYDCEGFSKEWLKFFSKTMERKN
jgi:hypothetical protein